MPSLYALHLSLSVAIPAIHRAYAYRGLTAFAPLSMAVSERRRSCSKSRNLSNRFLAFDRFSLPRFPFR
ncbi:MAG: hypothetical protein KZQ63_01105 [Candidatus Thiodiazotropha sp. (ex Lucinoma aequizonata)]|nr:hypothetical protein [Candidatus Thiodiazotropha sp. (ex Lucinoma aequizonata)]